MFGSWQSWLEKWPASSSEGGQWVLSGRQAAGAVLPRGAANSFHGAGVCMIMCCEPRNRAQCCSQISDTEGGQPSHCKGWGSVAVMAGTLVQETLFLLPPCSHPQSQLSFHVPVPSCFICAAKIAVEQNVSLTSILGYLLFKLFWSAFPPAECT